MNEIRNIPISYDEICVRQFSSLFSRLKHLFIKIDIGCPYGLPHVATFNQATFAPLSEKAMELFLAAGYRRNGNCLYNMHCATCLECIPIRLKVSDFKPNRNQRRAVSKNSDLALSLGQLKADRENIELCEKFLNIRYPRRDNTATGYYNDFFYNSIVNSGQLEYRLGEKLIGTAIIDIGVNWMNGVYFYFDPDYSKRSLGTYNILKMVDLCRKWGIEYLYLGYWIETVSAMSYKKSFRPCQVFVGNSWVTK